MLGRFSKKNNASQAFPFLDASTTLVAQKQDGRTGEASHQDKDQLKVMRSSHPSPLADEAALLLDQLWSPVQATAFIQIRMRFPLSINTFVFLSSASVFRVITSGGMLFGGPVYHMPPSHFTCSASKPSS